MNDPTIHLDGHIDVPEERRAGVAAALAEHVALSRAEPGCLTFELRWSVDPPGRLLVSESFVDEAAFAAHQERMKNSAWFAVTAGLARHYAIRKGG
ncbi:putative quinol monooxygenase [Prosthecomicrobium pneumaticum]|uniref:Quinol monooxygenase YgiN n=1 Tax=Prosthecomicrobium pneumaticum TaxID=81895 RepID=A0A7W9FKU2_9HYPH|nr:antibiotic biosynthesis monooxygenase [Prosthecomicrobium pneumaticum]MBB5751558.1 quinol monooxygenase YgiN [Prosthecomicrobium pneumaticum]